MALFTKKTQLDIVLDRGEVVAGQTLRARVDVGEPDGKVQGGRLELLYRNTFRYETRDADGDRSNAKRTEDVIVASHPLFEDAAAAGEVSVELAVPPRAPGSAPGSVEWVVRAVVDRKMARDVNHIVPIAVLSPPEQLAAWAEHPAANSSGVPMAMEVAPRTARPGSVISGRIEVRAAGETSARSVRVQLRRRRNDKDGLTDEKVVTKRELADVLELSSGEGRAWDFSLEVPADAPPSFEAHHNHQHWYVEGVLDRRLATDPTVQIEVNVHTA